MTSNSSSLQLAKSIMDGINPDFSNAFVKLIEFLEIQSDSAPVFGHKVKLRIGEDGYMAKLANKFAKGRIAKPPSHPATIPDEVVGLILHHYFDIPQKDLETIKKGHSLSMGAENAVGDLLERYLASILERKGWVWCSGSTAKSIDFIKKDAKKWILLQVKNRDNSENSPSSSVRDGTEIMKWHRSFSMKEGSNWSEFPEKGIATLVSEDGFKKYVAQYLSDIKNIIT